MERPCFDMLMKIKVLLENAKARDSDADPTVQNTRMRARYAKYHAISSIEARERAILRFHGASVRRGVTDAHMQSPSLRVFSRGDNG